MVLREEEKAVSIDVIDKGKGIDKPFIDRIFDRLFTIEDSCNHNIRGNGLELTIAQQLALQLGGTITVDNIPYVKTKVLLIQLVSFIMTSCSKNRYERN